jgi:hypothetical protein
MAKKMASRMVTLGAPDLLRAVLEKLEEQKKQVATS